MIKTVPLLLTLTVAAMTALPASAQEVEAPAATAGDSTPDAPPAVATEAPAQEQPAAPAATDAPLTTTTPPEAAPATGAAPAAPSAEAAAPAASATAPDAAPSTGPEAAATEGAPAATPVAAPLPIADLPAGDLHVETDLWELVKKAHWVVQAVMALLAVSIFAVLTIFLFKAGEFRVAFSRLTSTARDIRASEGVTAVEGKGPLADTARAAAAELAALPATLNADLRASARERLDLSLARIEAGAVQQLRSGTGLLASIGSVGPFVGLFGTVFGIMNSFLAIAATKTTNLAVVAPGIAEALLATGIGLVAAIPAVLLYNRVMRRIAAYRHGLADGTAEVLRRFSRALDARMEG